MVDKKIQKYLNLSNTIYLVLDKNAKILFANAKACNLLKIQKENIIGKNWVESFIPDNLKDEIYHVFSEIKMSNMEKYSSYTNLIIDSKGKLKKIKWNNSFIVNDKGDIDNIISSGIDITESERIKKEFKQTNERLELALIGGETGIWEWDCISNNTFYSKEWKKILGYEEDEISNKFEEWSKRLHRDDYEKVLNILSEAIEGKRNFFDTEQRLMNKEGKYIWVIGRGKVIERDKNGKPLRMLGTMTDITKTKKLYLKNEKSNRLLKIISTSNEFIVKQTDEEKLLKGICEIVTKRGGYKLSYISYFFEKENESEVDIKIKAFNFKEKYKEYEGKKLSHLFKDKNNSLNYRAINSKEPVITRSDTVDKNFNVWIEGSKVFRFNSSIMIPIIDQTTDKILGTFAIFSEEVDKYEDQEEVKILEEIAGDLSIGITSIRNKNRIIEEKEMYERFLNLIPGSVFIRDENLRFIFLNEYIKNTFNGNNWIGKTIDEAIPGEVGKKLKINEIFAYENGFLQKNDHLYDSKGNDVFQHTNLFRIKRKNEPDQLGGVALDITEMVKSQRELEKSNRKFKSYVENAPSGIFITDENGNYVDVNKSAEEQTGYKREELLNMNLRDLVTNDEVERAKKRFEKLKRDGSAQGITTFNRKNGEKGFWLIKTVKLDDNKYMGFTTEISELVEAERKLRENENLLRRYIDQAPEGIFIADKKGNYIDVNNAAIKQTGYSRDDLLQMNLIDLIPESYRDLSENHFNNLLNYGKSEGETVYQTKNGELRHWIVKAVKINDERFLGFTSDITERIKSEKEVKENKEMYEKFFDFFPGAVYIKDKNSKYKYLNNYFFDVLGVERDYLNKTNKEVIDYKKATDKMSIDDKKSYEEGNMQTFEKGKDKDGNEIFFQTYKFRIKREYTDDLIGGISLDVTDKMKLEEEKKVAYNRLIKNNEMIIETIVKIVELRDPYTAGHQKKVAQLGVEIAKYLDLSEEQIIAIKTASILHDIGKIYIPTEILNKAAKLTDLEFRMIKEHPTFSYNLVNNLEFDLPVAEYILQHHERLNGSGYPYGLKENEIHFESKIIALADVVEAISSHRPYRPALGIDKALEEIKMNSGILYDESIVKACIKIFEDGFEFYD